jgi:outer membrane receptor protein involved in Fe transport
MRLPFGCRITLLRLTAFAVACALSAEQGYAADATAATATDTNLVEIVVTAQRRVQNLQDVPAAVSAYSSADIANAMAHKVADIIVDTPNVTVNQPYGDGGPSNFVIRGISSTDFSLNQSKPVAVYLDEGIKQTQLFETVPLFDTERVEVLSGPQGTLYGKDATAGAVNIISKSPGFDPEGYLSAGYGNFDTRRFEGAVQDSLVSDVLAGRLAVTYLRDDGVFKNLTSGLGNTSQTDIAAARLSLLFRPSERFQTILRLVDTKMGGRNYTPLPTDINLSAYPNILAIPGALRQGLSFNENQTYSAPDRDIRSDSINLQSIWKPNEQYTVTSITTYDNGHWYDVSDAAGLPFNWQSLDSRVRAYQAVEDMRVVSNYTGPFNWQSGLFGSHDRVQASSDFLYNGDPRCGDECANPFGLPGQGTFTHNDFLQERTSYAGYFRGEYEIYPRLQITGGVRESYDELRVPKYNAYIGSNQVPDGIPSIIDQSRSQNFSNTSWEGGANWKATPTILLYASYKQGYRIGAENAQAFFYPAEVNLAPPETAQSEEVGFKSTWFDRALTLNAALFHTSYQNQQVLNYQDDALQLRSVSKSRINGFELEGIYRLTPNSRLNLNLGLLDPKYLAGEVDGVSVAGNQIVNAAKITATIGTDLTLYSADRNNVTLSLNDAYTARVYYDVFNTSGIAQSGYWLANGKLNWSLGHYEFSLYANNLFDRHYFVYSLYEESTVDLNFNLRGTPRQFGGEFTYRF